MRFLKNNRCRDREPDSQALLDLSAEVDAWLQNGPKKPPPVNRLCLPAMIMANCDPRRGRDLVGLALTRRRDDGLMVSRTEEAEDDHQPVCAAWPLWAGVAEQLHAVCPDPDWIRSVYPDLRNALLAAIKHFDPHRNGLPCWQSAEEAWDKDVYEDNLATPELITLLLMESDALLRLRPHAFPASADYSLQEERDHLANALMEFLADEKHGRFDARCSGGARRPLTGRLAVFPLLWNGLPPNWIGPLLARAQYTLPTSLEHAGTDSALIEIRLWRATLERLGAWRLQNQIAKIAPRNIPEQDVSQKPDRHAALKLALTADVNPRQLGSRWRSRAMRLFGGNDGRGLAAAACLLLAAVWGLAGRQPAVDAVSLELFEKQALIPTLPGLTYPNAALAKELEAAGVLPSFVEHVGIGPAEMDNRWDEAAALYQKMRDREDDSPTVVFGLARASGRLERRELARELWSEFLDRHGVEYPLAARAAREEWWNMETGQTDEGLADIPASMLQ